MSAPRVLTCTTAAHQWPADTVEGDTCQCGAWYRFDDRILASRPDELRTLRAELADSEDENARLRAAILAADRRISEACNALAHLIGGAA
jgi:hypothetical protein